MARSYLLLLLFCLQVTLASFGKQKELPSLTIFIHGTVMPYLAFTSPSWFINGEVSDKTNYAQLLKKARVNSVTYEEHPMLEEGFIHIPRQKIVDTNKGILNGERRRGIYYLVSAYDKVGVNCGLLKPDHEYAVYGWSGMNSIKAREVAGVHLYQHLVGIAHAYKDITIIGYSYGAHVALAMWKSEKVKKHGLKIKLLAMLGTPIQVETAEAFVSPMFESILSFRSDGDKVQTADIFSTNAGESFNLMGDLTNLERIQKNVALRRADVQFLVNDNCHIVDHCNMYMVGQPAAHEVFGHLPIVILLPSVIQQLIPQRVVVSAEAHIKIGHNTITTQIRQKEAGAWHRLSKPSINLYSTINEQRMMVSKYWKPLATEVQETVSKTYEKIKDALKAVHT